MTKSELIALLTYVYTRGYRHGHESSVDGSYIDVNHMDYETWHSDVVGEIVDEEPERFAHLSQPQPVPKSECSEWHIRMAEMERDMDVSPSAGTFTFAALAASPQPQPVAQGEAIGEVRENGVNWYGPNPHAFPMGTKFYTSAATIPTGHRVVPVEPTAHMSVAAAFYIDSVGHDEATVNGIYAAMIAASPSAGGV